MIVEVNGVRLAYDDRGAGTPIVFLHAFPLNRTMWAAQESTLSQRFRVITVDLRGHGESDAPLWRYTLDQYADDVNALLDHLSIQRAVMAGLSMGGYVLFAMYRRHSDRIRGLIFADTRAEADQPAQATWRFNLAQKVERVRAIILSTPISGIVGDLMAIAERPDSTPLLKTITLPTLVLVGDQDRLTTPEENRCLADGIPGARLEIIPGAGHLSNMEQPELFNQAVSAFMESIEGEKV
jgi:pimeloyl-ACP methyl ester carboxylesterase